ncbi:hypothetical protein JCM11251_000327 [Rhodosporidiobolus azoricus]
MATADADIPPRADSEMPIEEMMAIQEQLISDSVRPGFDEMIDKSGILSSTNGNESQSVLDLTYSGGLLVSQLEKRRDGGLAGLRIIFGDQQEESLQFGRKRVAENGWEDVNVRLLKFEDLALDKDTFDCIFLHQPEFGEDLVSQLLRQISTALTPTGVITAIVNVPLGDLARHEALSSADPPLDSSKFHPSDLAFLSSLYTSAGLTSPSFATLTGGVTNEAYRGAIKAMGIVLEPINQECVEFIDAEWAESGKEGLPRVEWEQLVIVAKKA